MSADPVSVRGVDGECIDVDVGGGYVYVYVYAGSSDELLAGCALDPYNARRLAMALDAAVERGPE